MNEHEEGKSSAPDSAEAQIPLTDAEKRFLLLLARRTLREHLSHRRRPEVDPADLTPGLLRQARCFVTLRAGEELRGCMGHRAAQDPLYLAVMESAISAATRDFRFLPVSPEELAYLTIHISVLTPFRSPRYDSLEDLLRLLIPGRHGVVLQHRWYSALYLPQVWERFEGLERPKEEFLASLSRKAGDETGMLWTDPDTEFEVFESVNFGEEEFGLPAGHISRE
jgi:AmmeMemoRadiSam system protein A